MFSQISKQAALIEIEFFKKEKQWKARADYDPMSCLTAWGVRGRQVFKKYPTLAQKAAANEKYLPVYWMRN